MEIFLALIPIVIIIAIVIRLAAGGMDHDRIRRYVEQQGGTVIDSSWAPFGPGWFGEKSDRIYLVRYTDRDGNEHEAHCKTSMWTGVYFTDDRIVRHAERRDGWREIARDEEDRRLNLEDENRRLREEVDRLRRGRSSDIERRDGR
jgi:hypothetical protein